MFGIDILHEEHENIRIFTKYVRQLCAQMMEGKEIEKDVLVNCVDFMKNYADIHHHGKEEEILFKVMLDNLGPIANKMVNMGMMIEHNIGRYHVDSLDKVVKSLGEEVTVQQKLDIATHALAYADLLLRHLEKENTVLYPFAVRNLSEELMNKVNEESKRFEEEGAKKGISRYVEWLRSVYQEEEA